MSDPTGNIIKRIQAMRAATAPDSQALRRAFHVAGGILSRDAKLNARRQGIFDTGNLWENIKYKLTKDGTKDVLEFGVYGVPYAAVHEFGYKGIQKIRAHSRVTRSGKTAEVRAHDRNVNIRARPYIRPALQKNRGKIVDLIREALSNGGE